MKVQYQSDSDIYFFEPDPEKISQITIAEAEDLNNFCNSLNYAQLEGIISAYEGEDGEIHFNYEGDDGDDQIEALEAFFTIPDIEIED